MATEKCSLVSVANPFDDRENEKTLKQNRAIILAVEGVKTEYDYFRCLNEELAQLDINAIVHIEVLNHGTTSSHSAPGHVFGLMEEYLELRSTGQLIPDGPLAGLEEKFGPDAIEKYLNSPETLDANLYDEIHQELCRLNIDLAYRKFLNIFQNPDDHFGIVIDRDRLSNRRDKLEELMRLCHEKGIGFYISNPCFDFWLLLHLCDVKTAYSRHERKLLDNKKQGKNTFLAAEISRRAHHKKGISTEKFSALYFPQINAALARAAAFASRPDELLDSLGTNLPELFRIIDKESVIFNNHPDDSAA